MTELIPPLLADVSSTAKLLYVVLEETGPCSMSDLRQQTAGCSDQSLRRALEELRDIGAVETRPHPRDGRKSRYDLATTLQNRG
ncbi:hypothetical protein [Haloarchaeobius sp. HRN-SO-5]|uniref:hypothetical protein n=1 Tax=Haloarchaeobius sp. HRN-SO-5 TaxID=3446118 RepID=UPI003EBDADE0